LYLLNFCFRAANPAASAKAKSQQHRRFFRSRSGLVAPWGIYEKWCFDRAVQVRIRKIFVLFSKGFCLEISS